MKTSCTGRLSIRSHAPLITLFTWLTAACGTQPRLVEASPSCIRSVSQAHQIAILSSVARHLRPSLKVCGRSVMVSILRTYIRPSHHTGILDEPPQHLTEQTHPNDQVQNAAAPPRAASELGAEQMERFFGQFRQGEHGGAVTKEYVSFKAGRCDVTDKGNNKFLITPDRRKGTVSLVKHQDELQHLQWKDRATNTVVEDVIIMGDATFSKINTGRPKDRVYLLQFSGGSSRRFFFWMQTKSDDKDENNAKKLNQYIQDPNMEVEAPPPPGGPAGGGNQQNVESILASMLGGAQAGAQAQPPQAPAQARPAGTSAAAPSSGTAGARATGQLTSADLQRAMLNISQMHAQQQAVNLAEVVNADDVLRSGVLRDPAVQEQLIPLLAEGQQNPEELDAIMRSPQLRSTLSSLTAALQTDNFNSIMSNFGLDPTRGMDALNRGNTIEAFLQSLLALQRDQSAEEEGEEGKQDEGKQS